MAADLKEKLAKISKDIETSKEVKRAEELKPIYKRIDEINNTKNQLDILKGSLGLKSGAITEGGDKGEKHGLGMKEYKADTEKEIPKKKSKIEVLMVEDKEVKEYLDKQGIKEAEQLAENPDFADTIQVQEYKEALKQKEGLEMSDRDLKKRLADLGVNIDEKNFSYESAEQAVNEKIKTVDAELLQEELKTPEGREKAMKVLVEKFKGDLVKMELSKDKENYELKLNDNWDFKIVVSKEKEKFHYWHSMHLPKNFESLPAVYGEELIKEALKKAYQTKLEENSDLFDRNNGNFASLKEQMKPLDPKEARKARELMNKFEEVQEEFRQMMKRKSEELEKKGIDFSPTHASSYGGNYEEYIQIGHYHGDEKEVENALNSANTFPSRFFESNHRSYDYIKLQELISKRIADVKRFSEEMNKIQTEKDIEIFMHGSRKARSEEGHRIIYQSDPTREEKSLISEFHELQMHSYVNKTHFEKFDYSGANNDGSINYNKTEKNFQVLKEMTEKCSTYSQAEDYLNNKILELAKIKERMINILDLAIDAQTKEKELFREAEKNEFGASRHPNGPRYDNPSYIKDAFDGIENEKKNALAAIGQITRLGLPEDEQIYLNGQYIHFPSVEEKKNELDLEKIAKEAELKTVQTDLAQQKAKEPGWAVGLFTRTEWQNKLTSLETKNTEINIEIEKKRVEINNLYNKMYNKLDSGDMDYLKGINKVKGTSQEIIQKLEKFAEQEAPATVFKLYNEYQAMVEKLNK